MKSRLEQSEARKLVSGNRNIQHKLTGLKDSIQNDNLSDTNYLDPTERLGQQPAQVKNQISIDEICWKSSS